MQINATSYNSTDSTDCFLRGKMKNLNRSKDFMHVFSGGVQAIKAVKGEMERRAGEGERGTADESQ